MAWATHQPAFVVTTPFSCLRQSPPYRLNYCRNNESLPCCQRRSYMCTPLNSHQSFSSPTNLDSESFYSIVSRNPSSLSSDQQEPHLELDTSDPNGPNFNQAGGGGTGSNGDDDDNGDGEYSRSEVLSKYGKVESEIPQDVTKISPSELDAYLKATRTGLSAFFATIWPGWRLRVAADPEFPFKLLMEQTVGLGLTVSGMVVARGANILNELDFAICDTIVGATMNFALVYLLTPVLGASSGGVLSRLPANLFAKGAFSVPTRIGGFLYKTTLFSLCGFAASIFGTTASQGLVSLRRSATKNVKKEGEGQVQPELPNLLVNSAAWAGFMMVSSSPRYQALAGVERLLFSYTPETIAKIGSASLRTGNNILGGATWVMWAKAIGLQKSEEEGKNSS